MRIFAMPILLVSDSTLWVVDYDESGIRKPAQQVDQTTLYVNRSHEFAARYGSKTYELTHLHIFTRKGFVDFLDKIVKAPALFRERVYTNVTEVKQHAARKNNL
jgi:hypothetical protein